MNILVAEDLEEKKKLVVEFLQKKYLNAKIHCAANRRETFSMLKERDFYCVILDFAMPDFEDSISINPIAGKDIIDEINFCEYDYPVIVITQYYEFNLDTNNEFKANDNVLFINENYRQGKDVEIYDAYTINNLPELHSFLSLRYNNYVGAIFYSSLSNEWENALDKLLDLVSVAEL